MSLAFSQCLEFFMVYNKRIRVINPLLFNYKPSGFNQEVSNPQIIQDSNIFCSRKIILYQEVLINNLGTILDKFTYPLRFFLLFINLGLEWITRLLNE